MEKTIEIPEGYEARIEGNKIILEPKESEDERIRKAIFQALSKKDARDVLLANGIQVSDALAWLEKQGETFTKKDVDDTYLKGICDAKHELEKQGSQNLANSAKTCKDEQNPIFRVGDYIRNTKTGNKVLIEQLDIATKAYCYVSYDGAAVNHSDFPFSQQDEWTLIGQLTVEQNPAWSKEDEEHVNSLLKRLKGLCRKELVITRFAVNEDEDWLKALKEKFLDFDKGFNVGFSAAKFNHWKPSDEQMDALDYVTNFHHGGYKATLVSLYEQLKKLRG